MMQTIMIRMSLHFLSALLGVLTILVLIQAQDQSGFISLDCGLPEDVSYSALKTGINYISDSKFIDTGVSKRLGNSEKLSEKLLEYVRSFPSGVRNCYRINVTSGTKYLIRATFYYGNYDNLNQPPQFDLHLGANVWDTVKFTNLSVIKTSEMIYTPSLDYIQLCLVNTGKGTPFISAIELRTLNNDTYVTRSAESVLLEFLRLGLSPNSITNLEYRYKDDVYDRLWFTFQPHAMKQLSASLNNDGLLLENNYKPPAIVMSTAATPVNVSAPLELEWEADNVNDQYYLYLHFNEVEELAANETRAFNITINGEFLYGPMTPRYRSADTILTTTPLTGAARYQVSLSKTKNSTLPPILNAIEVYKVKDFSQSETQQDDVDAIKNIKNAYGVARNWQGDPCGPLKYMWEGLNCSIDGYDPPRITSLNLSSSGLIGQIESSISKLTMLQYLDLSNNSLNGPLPDFLIQLHSLKVLNVGKNKLTGLVPSGLLERSKTKSLSLSMDDNSGLCTTKSCRKKSSHVPLIASISAIIVAILLISLGFWIFRRHKVTSTNSMKRGSLIPKQHAFSYTEILNITDNFKTIIGEGGFGEVYFGTLQNQTQVAVKRLSPSSVQGYKEFQSEAQLLMIVHHRNLVPLIGYCDEDEIKALLYEYMANGNLHQHLLVENTNILKWNERLNIAVDAANGLDYLHNGCKPPIIHRDLKPSNILLDENMHAKIADFGISRTFVNDIDSHISTCPAGTFGYVDPEVQRTGNTNKKNDVYSFGIVLFVLITGRQAIVRAGGENINILEWVIPIIERGDIQNVVDPKLEGEFSINSAWKVVEIAMSCISPNAVERPDMSLILAELKECLSLDMVQRNYGNTRAIDELVSFATVSETALLAR
ncbi:probable LRR receptor-like serine/threonine-protein kinase At1g05700 isoform X2 [Trifolium pratense]|uniref:probable LRR receptor-like serine/threonine-protein kinase At1g05700 isoform X2 n=1 Tax=Trifolium pratense TaxID=57577 RepID=UPI001E6933EC|nr:probable LRR receptor-like serine/threonine-protein kinase At1g05700 isoform X2 [Trifolium pratense]